MTLLNRRGPAPLVRHAARPAVAARPVAAHAAPARRPAAAVPAVPVLEGPELPPSVARVADRTRLSRELLAAILEVEARTRVTLEDIERADALAERLLARRRARLVRAVA